MERNMQLEDPNNFFSFVQELENMGWNVLGDPSEEIHLDIIKDLYANAKPWDDDAMISRVSWVRGWQVPYDRETIREYLEDTFMENPNEVDPLSKVVVRNN